MRAQVIQANRAHHRESSLQEIRARCRHCDRGAYECRADVAEINVPATLQAAISARIDRLEPSAKRALSAASVIGSRFSTDLLTSLGIDPVLDDLVNAELYTSGAWGSGLRLRAGSSTRPRPAGIVSPHNR